MAPSSFLHNMFMISCHANAPYIIIYWTLQCVLQPVRRGAPRARSFALGAFCTGQPHVSKQPQSMSLTTKQTFLSFSLWEEMYWLVYIHSCCPSNAGEQATFCSRISPMDSGERGSTLHWIFNYLIYFIFSFFFHKIKGFMVMIHWNPGWLGSRFKIIVINIFVKALGGNEWGSFQWNQ